MDLIVLVLVLSLVGFATWFITTRIPMDPTVRLIIQILVLIVLVIYVLRRLGASLPNVL